MAVWFALAAAGLLATSLAAAASLRLASPVAFALAAYLLAGAEIVVLTEVLSLPAWVGPTGYTVGEAVLLAAAAAAWHLRGRPRPPRPRPPAPGAWRRHPIVIALALVVGAAAVYELFVSVGTPPDNWDSMTYHLSRAAAWYQRHRVEYVPAHTSRQNAYQPNSEMAILYTFAFLGRDTLAALPQWLAQLATLGAVYGIARRLSFPRPASLFAALATGTLTEIALQSVTTQNDLTSASLVLAAAAFALGRTRTDAALAGLAVALALGTKLTSVFALPLLVALALARLGRRRFLEAAAFALAAFVAVGLYGYALNLAETGRPLGARSATTDLEPVITTPGTVSSVARLAYRFVDLSGFHPPSGLVSGIADAGRAVFDGLGIQANPFESSAGPAFDFVPNTAANEDLSTFGPLGLLLLVPLSLGFVVALALRRTSWTRGVLALAIPLYLVEIAFTYRYNTWVGRFLVTPAALTTPLAAWLYPRRAVVAAVAVLGAVTLGLAQAYNHAKPTGLGGTTPVWDMSRAEAMSVQRPEMLQVIEGLDQYVGPHKTIGYVLAPDDWDYPLYGATLGRHLVKMPTRNMLAWAITHHVHWILLGTGATVPRLYAHWEAVSFHDSGWTLLLRSEEYG